MAKVPPHELSHLYPHAPKDIAPGWHVAWGNRGPMLRRDADYERWGNQAQLWPVFDVTRTPSTTYGRGGRYTTTSTGELVCHFVVQNTVKGERFRYRLPNGYVSRLYRSWVSAGRAAWGVMHAHDPNIGLPLPARVHGLADDAAPTPPLPAPPAPDRVTRPAPARTTRKSTRTHIDRTDNDHGRHQRTTSGGQTGGRARGGADHLVFDAAECGDSGTDD